MKGKYSTLVNNTLIFAIGSFGSRLITFFLVPLYTNVLTTTQFGIADFVLTCSFFIIPIVSLAIHEAVLRFGLSEGVDYGQVGKNALLVLLTGSIVLLSTLPLINMYDSLAEWRWYFVFLVITSELNSIISIYAKAKDQNKLFAACSILQTFVLAIVNILLLVVVNCGVHGFLIANILSNLVSALVLAKYTHIFSDSLQASFNKVLLKKMIIYALPLVVNSLSWWLLNSSDRIMLEHYLSASALGIFAAASKIPALMTILIYIFLGAWTISSIKEYETEQDKKFYTKVFTTFSFAVHLGACIIIAIAYPFMQVYVGEEFHEAWVYCPVLILGTSYYAFSSFFGAIYDAAKKNISVAVTTFIAGTINIAVNLLLIPTIGIWGACISTMFGYLVIFLLRMFHSKRYLNFPINGFKLFFNVVVLFVQAVLVSMNYYIFLVSLTAIITIMLINRSDISYFYYVIKNKIKLR